MARELATITFLPAETWKGLKRRVHFVKRKESLLRQSLMSVLLGWDFFSIRAGFLEVEWAESFWLPFMYMWQSLIGSLSTSEFLGWVASYEFSCFNWKTAYSSALGPKSCISNSSVSSSTFSNSAISAAKGLGEMEEKDLCMVSPVLSTGPGLEKVWNKHM